MNDRFLRACRREPVDATPIWLMRQAGRYLTEYRKIREHYGGIIEICKNPEASSSVASLPVERLGVDAAIIFADIMLPLEGMGVSYEIVENVGPVLKRPLRTHQEVEGLSEFEPDDDVPFVLESIEMLRSRLNDSVPVIGFSGAPFTLASYLIEGKPTRDFAVTKTMMYRQPDTWHLLLRKLARMTLDYVQAQVRAGVRAFQVFDSWVGALSAEDYKEFVMPFTKQIFEGLVETRVPRIHFTTGTAGYMEQIRSAGGDVISLDWRIPIDEAWLRLGYDVAIQGNLDPAAMLASPETIEKKAIDIIRRVGNRPGHIFNLGHGVLPDTPVENVERLVEFVHAETRRG